MKSLIDNFNNDLADNETARASGHAAIDQVHDSIRGSIQQGIATITAAFSATAPVPTVVASPSVSPSPVVTPPTESPAPTN